jgi:hypothetical protein
MPLLVNFLSILFISLILYQLFLAYTSKDFTYLEGFVEGLETDQVYKDYDGNDAMILSQQNAGNIKVLKGQFDGIQGLDKRVTDLQTKVDTIQEQVNGIVSAQQDFAQQSMPSEPVSISGTEEEGDDV